MPAIDNIPESIITEHVNWHTKPGNPGGGGRTIDPWPPSGGPAAGSGQEFLVWHEGFISRFGQWVDSLPANERPQAGDISPWTAIPTGLKMGMVGWNAQYAAEESQLADMSNFASLDDLGRFLEWSLHGWLHFASSNMWNEPVLLSFESPRSTYFWQLHGLIDHWRQQWVDSQRVVIPDFDRDHIKEILELKRWLELLGRLDEPILRIPRPQPDPSPLRSRTSNLQPGDLRLIRVLRELELRPFRSKRALSFSAE